MALSESSSEDHSEFRKPLRRLQRVGGQAVSFFSGSETQTLEDDLAQMTLRKKPLQSGFAAELMARKPLAGWSSSESEEDSCISGSSSDQQPRELVQPEDSSLSDREALVLGKDGEFRLAAKVSRRLYAHQVKGVEWLWSLYQLKKGGILGDDMGLGKTLQCSAFLAGMLKSNLIRRAIIVAPKTLLAQWKKELGICGLQHMTHELAPTSGKCGREEALDSVFLRPGILLTTYGMVQHNAGPLSSAPNVQHSDEDDDDRPLWDLMILDEGHKIKNAKTITAQRLREIPTAVAVIISGTPIQNNLMELYALFDFVCPGLLGDQKIFKMEYERVITRGNSKDATSRDREMASGRSKALRDRCAPFFLRREKRDILQINGSNAVDGADESGHKPQTMGRKNDLVVWLRLRPQQKCIYEAFLNSQAVKDVLNQSKSALAAITVLKKICVHPNLLSERAVDAVAYGGGKLAEGKRVVTGDDFVVDDSDVEYETASSAASEESGESAHSEEVAPQHEAVGGELEGIWASWADGQAVDDKLRAVLQSKDGAASCKTLFVAALIKELQRKGHRTLIFSQSRVMLDILGAELQSLRLKFLRIDGTLSAAHREALVQEFQANEKIPVFLLTSQVGGLGLTLTAANRVIIIDPSWNPAMDDQSVDRAYRIGQRKDVVVYRLISCGTVEEKIYRKQVFKGGLSRSGMEDGIPFQYFSKQDLRDLFRLQAEELVQSKTQQQLHELHAAERNATPELKEHLQLLQTLPCYSGVSDHDLLYSRKDTETGSLADTGAAFPAIENQPRIPPLPKPRITVSRHGAGGDKTGWGGGGDISDMLSKSLNLGGNALAAKAPGAGWAEPRFQLDPTGTSNSVPAMKEQVQRLRRLESSSLRLPDGGLQLQNKIRELEQRIAAAEQPQVIDLDTNQGCKYSPEIVAVRSTPKAGKRADLDGVQTPKLGTEPEKAGKAPPTAGYEQLHVEELTSPDVSISVALERPPHTKSEVVVEGQLRGPKIIQQASSTQQSAPGIAGALSGASGRKMEAGGAVPRLAAALQTPFPDEEAAFPNVATLQRVASGSELARLKAESAALKETMRGMVGVLNDTQARAKLSDGGRQLKAQARQLEKQRNAIKEHIKKLEDGRI